MKFGIAFKMGLMATVLVCVTAGVVALTVSKKSTETLVEHKKTDLKDETKKRALSVLSQIAKMREDVLYLAGTRPIQEIVRAKLDNKKEDTDTTTPYEKLRTELGQLFERICRNENGQPKPYYQVRLIKIETKREIVRVQRIDKDSGEPSYEPVAFNELDNDPKYFKKDRSYFEESITKRWAKFRDVYFSKIERNVESGKAETVTVLRAVAPVFQRDKTLFGVVVINLDIRSLEEQVLHQQARTLTYLTDKRGHFLVHPEGNRALNELAVEKRATIMDLIPNLDGCYLDDADSDRDLWEVGFQIDAPGDEWKASEASREPAANGIQLADEDESVFSYLKLDLVSSLTKEDMKDLEGKLESYKKQDLLFCWDKLRDDSTTLVVRASSPELLQEVARYLTSESDEFADKIRGGKRRDCKNFVVQFYRLYYNPNDPKEFLGLATARSLDEFEADAQDLAMTTLLPVVLSILLGGTGACILSWWITRRLKRITDAAQHFSSLMAGDDSLDGAVAISLPAGGNDEVSVLGQSLSALSKEVLERTRELAQLNRDLEDRVDKRTTELKHSNEQLADADHYKTALLRAIYHDTKSPLQYVEETLERLESQHGNDLSTEERSDVRLAIEGCREIKDITDDLKTIAQCQEKSLTPDKNMLSVRDWITGTVRMLELQFEGKQLKVTIDLDSAPEHVVADKSMCRRVLTNLLTNSCKYTPKGGSVRVLVERCKPIRAETFATEEHMKITVADTGVGVPKQDLTKVWWKDFHRCSNVKNHFNGLGIGLALSRHLVELHWGTVGVKSEENVGSEFWFTIPCDPQDIGQQTLRPAEDHEAH